LTPLRKTIFSRFLVSLVPAILALGLGPSAQSNVNFMPASPDQLLQPVVADEMVRVKGAKVAWANFAALKRDFAVLAGMTDTEISEWLLDQFAYISRAQLQLNGIRHTPIPVDTDHPRSRKFGYRPPDYHRAALMPITGPDGQPLLNPDGTPAGLVDMKGAGNEEGSSKIPKQVEKFNAAMAANDHAALETLRREHHAHGLMSLGETFAETSRQQAAQMLFEIHNVENSAHGANLQTVESYFSISLPFDIIKDTGQRIRAGLYGRQAHFGRTTEYPVPSTLYVDPPGYRQGDSFGAAVDWGGVIIEDGRLKGKFGLRPGGNPKNPRDYNAWIYAHDSASAFVRKENPDMSVAYRHLEQMLRDIRPAWDAIASQIRPVRHLTFEEAIAQGLASPEVEFRENVTRVLNGYTGPRKEEFVAKALGDSVPQVRRLAAAALGNLSSEHSQDLLLQTLNDSDVLTRRYAAESLAGSSGSKTVALFTKALSDPDPQVVKDAFVALKKGSNERISHLWSVIEASPDALPKKVQTQLKAVLRARTLLPKAIPAAISVPVPTTVPEVGQAEIRAPAVVATPATRALRRPPQVQPQARRGSFLRCLLGKLMSVLGQ
jgi:hypothetical protein